MAVTVFLTGGSGFLGSHVAEALAGAGHRVIAMVRATSRAGHLERTGASLVTATLDEPSTLVPALAESDAVVHVAGLVKAVRAGDFARVNCGGTRRLAEAAARHAGGKTFVLVSSIAAQGPGDGPGQRQVRLPEAPVTAYGRSKLDGEKAVLEFASDLAVTILRPPMIYGPRDVEFLKILQVAARWGFVPVVERGQVVSVIHARDAALAVRLAVEVPHATPAVYPHDDGQAYTWDRIADVAGEVLGRRVRVIATPRPLVAAVAWAWETWGRATGTPVVMSLDKVNEAAERFWICGNSAIGRDLGFRPGIDLREGFRETVEWARAEGIM